ncbi:MAG: hypothetical protein KDB63_01620 [Nocardioidaceae bacterium]|nr:hypothetical protein [Nocardioidaceae bacterium]
MSTAQWILNGALLAWVLTRNVGTKPLTRATFAVPAAIVLVAGLAFLRDLPSAGHDLRLEVVGAVVGCVLGLVATSLTRVRSKGADVVVRAGVAFAALWVVVIGGRVAFAEWATHSGAQAVGEFSMRHQITGADAWTAAFVLMSLAMVVTRYVSTGAVAAWVTRRGTVSAEVAA